MMADRDQQELDPRIQAYLDGELDRTAREAFERALHEDAQLARQVAALKNADAWLQSSRTKAPAGLAAAIERTLGGSRQVRRPARASAQPAVRDRSADRGPWLRTPFWRWALPGVGAMAAALLLIVFWGPGGLEDGGADRPAPSGEQAGVPAAEGSRHHFILRAPGAEQVCLVGNFNRWEVCATPLAAENGDLWQVSVDLPPGRYEYMFVVDDHWITDPQAAVHIDDGFGNRNALLIL